MKKSALISVILACILLVSCVPGNSTTTEASLTETSEISVTAETTATGNTEDIPEPLDVILTLEDIDGEVPLLSRLQEGFMSENDYNSILKYADAETENSRPRYLKLKWAAEYAEKPDEVSYTVRVSKYEDLRDAREIEFEDMRTLSVLVYNLEPGTRYFWNVTAKADGKQTVSETKTFSTVDSTPWVVYIAGVTNCRDIGGWKTADGGHVKRGMIFRTAALNNNCTDRPRITEEGIDTMLNVLKVNAEIDLRGHIYEDGRMENGITSSVLGDSVKYLFCPLEYDHAVDKDTDEIRRVFGYLADETNYPLFIHCAIGTDRTGMISTIIEALLGVSEHDIYMDYVFSNFGAIATRDSPRLVDEEKSYLAQLKAYGGDNPSEWARNYLLSIGVTEAEIDEIVRIMKES